MTEKKGRVASRRPYRKPQLEQVKLVAEEAVLVGCKTKKATGPDAGPCNATGGRGKCVLDAT
jgi:hypothetical protein